MTSRLICSDSFLSFTVRLIRFWPVKQLTDSCLPARFNELNSWSDSDCTPNRNLLLLAFGMYFSLKDFTDLCNFCSVNIENDLSVFVLTLKL